MIRWRKVWRDLWLNKSRTGLAVTSITIGVFAIGVMLNSQVILNSNFNDNFDDVNPASAVLLLDDFDSDLVSVVQDVPGVEDVEAKRVIMSRLSYEPDQWFELEITAFEDFDNIRVNRVDSESGQWPPAPGTILIDRTVSGEGTELFGLEGVEEGDSVFIQTSNGESVEMLVSGLAYDFNRTPTAGSGTIYGYVTFETLAMLGESQHFNTLHITVPDDLLNKPDIRRITDAIRETVAASDHMVYRVVIPPPGEHPVGGPVSGIFFVLGLLATLSLLAGSFLVVNMVSALLAQQTRQLGVIKAVGGRSPQLLAMYLGMVLMLSALSLLIAVPLGAIVAMGFVRQLATLINVRIESTSLAPEVIGVQIIMGLLVPVLAAFYPVLSRVRISVRQAIKEYGTSGIHSGLATTLTRQLKWLPLVTQLAVRNTFRRPSRLVLTLAALSLSGMLFISNMTVRASLFQTLDDSTSYLHYDLQVIFTEDHSPETLTDVALDVDEIAAVEPFAFTDQADYGGETIMVFALPAQSTMLTPQISDGRWLETGDQEIAIINTALQRDHDELEVGRDMMLMVKGRPVTVTIAGVFEELAGLPGIFVNLPAYQTWVDSDEMVNGLWMETRDDDPDAQLDAMRAFEKQMAAAGLSGANTMTLGEREVFLAYHFNLVTVMLMVMTILLAIVGGMGLTSSISISVIERTREIGILRAIGAQNRIIIRTFVGEAVVIALLSWLIGSVLAIVPARYLSDGVGDLFLFVPLHFTFSFFGMGLWMGIVTGLATLAGLAPAYRASRVSIRDTLAYE